MYYIETSVLFAWTLGKRIKPERFKEAEKLLNLLESKNVRVITSFYTLHELFTLALSKSVDITSGLMVGKEVLRKIINQKQILIVPLLRREEKIENAHRFKSIKDSSDIPHAISAFINGCEGIVTYDFHFDDISDVISPLLPKNVIKKLQKSKENKHS